MARETEMVDGAVVLHGEGWIGRVKMESNGKGARVGYTCLTCGGARWHKVFGDRDHAVERVHAYADKHVAELRDGQHEVIPPAGMPDDPDGEFAARAEMGREFAARAEAIGAEWRSTPQQQAQSEAWRDPACQVAEQRADAARRRSQRGGRNRRPILHPAVAALRDAGGHDLAIISEGKLWRGLCWCGWTEVSLIVTDVTALHRVHEKGAR